MPKWQVLVVEYDVTYRTALARFLSDKLSVTLASTVREAVQCLRDSSFHLALIDLNLPDGSGFDLMKKARRLMPHMTIIVMTGQGTVETAVKAIQKGAFHYLMKPFPMERLEQLIREAMKHQPVVVDTPEQVYHRVRNFNFEDIIGKSPCMLEVFSLVEKVSTSDSTILIRGESGTGKELIAKAIHEHSNRWDKAFVAVNCGALQEELLESELFGHVKGAFTGAVSSRPGRFEVAHQGTIFLDEVGDMSLRLQVKLLRVLQEKQFEPLGSSKTVGVDVRIIAATHQDLEQAVSEKRFREDLYYRLNVIPLFMPPLRQRTADIPLLIYFFLKKYNQKKNKKVTGFSNEALRALCAYPWPGNVRELENLVERLTLLKDEGDIVPRDLPDKYFSPSPSSSPSAILPQEGVDLNRVVGDVEDELIRQALLRAGGNRNKAARLLGLKRTTLVEKLKRKKAPSPEG